MKKKFKKNIKKTKKTEETRKKPKKTDKIKFFKKFPGKLIKFGSHPIQSAMISWGVQNRLGAHHIA